MKSMGRTWLDDTLVILSAPDGGRALCLKTEIDGEPKYHWANLSHTDCLEIAAYLTEETA